MLVKVLDTAIEHVKHHSSYFQQVLPLKRSDWLRLAFAHPLLLKSGAPITFPLTSRLKNFSFSYPLQFKEFSLLSKRQGVRLDKDWIVPTRWS